MPDSGHHPTRKIKGFFKHDLHKLAIETWQRIGLSQCRVSDVIRPIHPFPARMAPELALNAISCLKPDSIVLDPMTGSGTVIRQANDLGHDAIGFDMDPLAVLMSRVWTTPVEDGEIERIAREVVEEARGIDPEAISLPWIDGDPETAEFIGYWFGPKQTADLRRLAYAIARRADDNASIASLDVIRIALSRLIVTKENGASLARDVSHSRPHRVMLESDYEVMPAFERSARAVRSRLLTAPPQRRSTVALGDARVMDAVKDASVDAVLTSPPYLNAIDYLRGHRLSLVWLGHRLGDLRTIRSNSIGAERAPDRHEDADDLARMRRAMGTIDDLPAKFWGMIDRYIQDLRAMTAEIARVMKQGAQATFVVGNSCLRGVFIRNSEAVSLAAKAAGLTLLNENERELPNSSRYLPITAGGSLAKRMRTETILTFTRP